MLVVVRVGFWLLFVVVVVVLVVVVVVVVLVVVVVVVGCHCCRRRCCCCSFHDFPPFPHRSFSFLSDGILVPQVFFWHPKTPQGEGSGIS